MPVSGPKGYGVVRNSGKRYMKLARWFKRVTGKEADKG